MDGFLLQTAEAFGDSFHAGEMWELLQAEKEHVAQTILTGGLSREEQRSTSECEASEEADREITWHRRETLEDRLRAINDAQDRLIDGGYGTCVDCGNQIGVKRLCADPAASLCIKCRSLTEGEIIKRRL
jgi:RNA polymerase-binding transcription factor DksA